MAKQSRSPQPTLTADATGALQAPPTAPLPAASPPAAAGSTPVAPTAIGATMPPVPGAPAAPAGFMALTRDETSALTKPSESQVAGAVGVAAELRASSAYTDDFGEDAPPAETLASQLAAADAWTVEEQTARTYLRYASSQKNLAWDTAMATIAALKPEYDHATQHDATVVTRYAHLDRFINGRKAAAARALATRRANKKASEDETQSPAPAPAPAAAPPAPANTQGPRAA